MREGAGDVYSISQSTDDRRSECQYDFVDNSIALLVSLLPVGSLLTDNPVLALRGFSPRSDAPLRTPNRIVH